jgi:hypothetical protein
VAVVALIVVTAVRGNTFVRAEASLATPTVIRLR